MGSIMYHLLKQNKEKTIYFILFTFIAAFFLLVTVVFKNDEEIRNKKTNTSFQHQDLSTIKEFLLSKLKSPFINIDYKIKSGDSIQKILKKFKIQNNEIANIINQYKKHGNPNQLLTGNRVDIVVEKDLYEKNNFIVKFSIPITKSSTIEITKNEQGKISSKKNYY